MADGEKEIFIDGWVVRAEWAIWIGQTIVGIFSVSNVETECGKLLPE